MKLNSLSPVQLHPILNGNTFVNPIFLLERANFLMITGIWAWPQFSSSKPAIKNVARSTPKQTLSYHMMYFKTLDVSFYLYSAWVFIFNLYFKALDDSRHPYTCQVKPK